MIQNFNIFIFVGGKLRKNNYYLKANYTLSTLGPRVSILPRHVNSYAFLNKINH